METAGVEPSSSGTIEALCRQSVIPKVMRTGGFEPPQRGAAALQAVELANAQASARKGDRPDSNLSGRALCRVS
jgi:hypothetical protein